MTCATGGIDKEKGVLRERERCNANAQDLNPSMCFNITDVAWISGCRTHVTFNAMETPLHQIDAMFPEVSEELLPKVPATVFLDRRTILKQTLLKLQQQFYEKDIDNVDNTIYVCRVTIGLPPYRLSFEASKKTFIGVSTSSSNDSVQKACENALSHLEEYSLVVVDDLNYSKKKTLAQATMYAEMLQDKLMALQQCAGNLSVMQQDMLAKIIDLATQCPLTLFVKDEQTTNAS